MLSDITKLTHVRLSHGKKSKVYARVNFSRNYPMFYQNHSLIRKHKSAKDEEGNFSLKSGDIYGISFLEYCAPFAAQDRGPFRFSYILNQKFFNILKNGMNLKFETIGQIFRKII